MWSEADRLRAIDDGRWRAQETFAGIAGFHINAFGCKGVSLPDAMLEMDRSRGNPEREKAFANLVEAKPYTDAGEAPPDWAALYERREPYTLSGGEKQRVALAGLLAVEPEILVLDEPTSMLDAAGRREVLEYLQVLRSEKTVLHVTHHLEELLDSDRILVLNGGELVADETPERFFSSADLLRENRLVLPVVPRLALELGFPPAKLRTAEELAEAILARTQSGTRAG